jgi:hypothetical protein
MSKSAQNRPGKYRYDCDTATGENFNKTGRIARYDWRYDAGYVWGTFYVPHLPYRIDTFPYSDTAIRLGAVVIMKMTPPLTAIAGGACGFVAQRIRRDSARGPHLLAAVAIAVCHDAVEVLALHKNHLARKTTVLADPAPNRSRIDTPQSLGPKRAGYRTSMAVRHPSCMKAETCSRCSAYAFTRNDAKH